MRHPRFKLFAFVLTLIFVASAYAAITGVISGTVSDSSGAVLPGVTVVVLNEDTGVKQAVVTDDKGFYSFPALDVGRYSISTSHPGFEKSQVTGIKVDANSSVRTDIELKVGRIAETVQVTSNDVQVETQSTQLGEVIDSTKMTAVPLNGRAFTDLLALQPGVSPYTGTESADTPAPSGGLNGGNMSINGGRGASNGFMVNGGNVNDGVENSSAIVPNLDSISEFRIITGNFDAEYGNFSGGQVNVVTKNGTNQWHGSGFEFFRNTALNARGYSFSTPAPPKGSYQQNIYGGTLGGPVKKDKVFFFADFQGTNQAIGTANSVVVPSAQNLNGDLSDWTNQLLSYGGTVQGVGWAQVLSNRLGYTVSANEPYFGDANCTQNSNSDPCVFPGAIIPKSAWDSAAGPMLKYIPKANGTAPYAGYGPVNAPGNLAPGYVTNSAKTTLGDYKESARVDVNTRFGTLFGYYFMDNTTVINPYDQGITDPGFSDEIQQRAQMSNIGLTTTFKNNSVNTFRFTYVRSAAHSGIPTYALPGPSLASLGFVSSWGPSGGIGNIEPSLAGVPSVQIDEGGTFGTPTEQQARYVNTFQWLDNYMKVVGTHTFQFGGNYHYDQINARNFYDANGGFGFSDNNETGLGFADYLLGAENGSFTQASPQVLDSRSHYIAAYAEDAWRARSNLALNYGVRWEVSTPWYDTGNKIQTIIPGEQSVVFPGAPLGWVFPGDPGVPRTLAPIRWKKFAPRFGFAYTPSSSNGLLAKIIGGPDKLSIRGGYGIFYTNFQDESGFVVIGDAPFGEYYQAPVQTMLSTPYVDRGTQNIQSPKFPFKFPPSNVSASNPDNSVDWSTYEPISSAYAVGVHNTVPYVQNYYLAIQREVAKNTVFTVSYVGNVGRHLANREEANPGNTALCLSLNASTLAPGQTPCGPHGESQAYTLANGTVVPGTRPLGLAFGANPYLLTQGTSNYNSLQTNLKHSSRLWEAMIGYTFGRSFDNSSGLTDATNPINPKASYSLSSYNVNQYLVASFDVHLPFAEWTQNGFTKAVVGGWTISGITKMATGMPISMSDRSDYSLTGASGVDMPFYTPGHLFAGGQNGDRNPRHRNPYFNTSLFLAEKAWANEYNGGTPGVVGDSHRRFISGPGLDHTDLALMRDFHIHESHAIEFRGEAFNFMNHTEFDNPSGNISSGTFGLITATSSQSNPRILQAAVKYRF